MHVHVTYETDSEGRIVPETLSFFVPANEQRMGSQRGMMDEEMDEPCECGEVTRYECQCDYFDEEDDGEG